jgi:beta-glucosidase-like glycosyl hydrolase
MTKKWLGLDQNTHINESQLVEDLNSLESVNLNSKLVEKSITLLQNESDLLPLKRLDTLKMAVVCIGEESAVFESTLSNYATLKTFHLNEQHSDKESRC